MKQRFGVDPQFPVSRYVNGLTSKNVPNQAGEHPMNNGVPSSTTSVTPTASTRSSRRTCRRTRARTSASSRRGRARPDLVYFAAITGITPKLLYSTPGRHHEPEQDVLSDSDWTAIIGQDPHNYDFTGADFHMIESEDPERAGHPV